MCTTSPEGAVQCSLYEHLSHVVSLFPSFTLGEFTWMLMEDKLWMFFNASMGCVPSLAVEEVVPCSLDPFMFQGLSSVRQLL